jgi:hypothetical protein
MSKGSEHNLESAAQQPNTHIETSQRRLFIFRAAAVLGGAAALALGTSGEARADTGFGHQDKGSCSSRCADH